MQHHIRRGNPGKRWHHHFIPRPHPQRDEGQVQGGGGTGDCESMFDLVALRKELFKLPHLRTAGQPARFKTRFGSEPLGLASDGQGDGDIALFHETEEVGYLFLRAASSAM